jgi:hypothetical protein
VCQLNGGISSDNVKVDTRLKVIREVHASWINEIFAYLIGRPDDIRKGFEKLGISIACRTHFTVDDNPFADLLSI